MLILAIFASLFAIGEILYLFFTSDQHHKVVVDIQKEDTLHHPGKFMAGFMSFLIKVVGWVYFVALSVNGSIANTILIAAMYAFVAYGINSLVFYSVFLKISFMLTLQDIAWGVIWTILVTVLYHMAITHINDPF
jgi:uncharacterized membrane protein